MSLQRHAIIELENAVKQVHKHCITNALDALYPKPIGVNISKGRLGTNIIVFNKKKILQ